MSDELITQITVVPFPGVTIDAGVGYRWNVDHRCCDGWCATHQNYKCELWIHSKYACGTCAWRRIEAAFTKEKT